MLTPLFTPRGVDATPSQVPGSALSLVLRRTCAITESIVAHVGVLLLGGLSTPSMRSACGQNITYITTLSYQAFARMATLVALVSLIPSVGRWGVWLFCLMTECERFGRYLVLGLAVIRLTETHGPTMRTPQSGQVVW